MTPGQPAPPRPGTLGVWWAAIRPRTLGMALAPVMLGTALAVADGVELAWAVLLATAACALLIQIGTNLYNDAVDFERGTDRPERLGPLRVTLAGWASALANALSSVFGIGLLSVECTMPVAPSALTANIRML